MGMMDDLDREVLREARKRLMDYDKVYDDLVLAVCSFVMFGNTSLDTESSAIPLNEEGKRLFLEMKAALKALLGG